MKRLIPLSALSLCLIALPNSRADETPADAAAGGEKITFADHVMPVLRQHCLNCHQQSDKKGGLALDSYGALLEGGGSGEVVYDDGDIDSSRLWQLVNHDDTPEMPPNQPKIPEEQLTIIRKWIEGGILENSGSKAKPKKKNALASVKTVTGRPEGGGAMPALNIPQKVPVVTPRPSAATAIAASPWAPVAAVAGQKQIVLYHTDSAELLGVLPFPEGIAQSLRFSVDGSYLIAGGGEHSVRGMAVIYDVKTGQPVATIGDELDTVFDADVNAAMNRVAMGGPQKMLRIYDATDGELLFDIKKHTDWIYSVAFSPDGVLIASADRSGGLHVWEAETGRLFLDLPGHKGAVRSLVWRDDSNILVSSSEDGTVRLWDMVSGKQVKSIDTKGGATPAVDVDHSGNLATAHVNRRVKVWDATGKHLRDLKAMPDEVLEIAFTHDGKKVIYGDWSGAIVMVATDDPKKVQNLASNPPTVAARAKSTQKVLVSVQQQLAPLAAALKSATDQVAAAEANRQSVQAQITGLQNQSKAATDQAGAARAAANQLAAALKVLESKSQDLSDAMIAAKVAAKGDPKRIAEQSKAEETFANHLLATVNHRRSIDAKNREAGSHQKSAADLAAKAKTLAGPLAEADQAIAGAKAKLVEAQKAHQVVASRLSRVEAKHQHLMSQMN